MKIKIQLIALLCGIPLIGSGQTAATQNGEKPNIFVVLTDDQGWADVGFNGATDIPTPNLDRLASEGVIFH